MASDNHITRMIAGFRNCFKIPELKERIIFTLLVLGCLPVDRLGAHSRAGRGGVAKLLQPTAREAKRGWDWFYGHVQHVHRRRLGAVLHWRSGHHALHKCYDYSAVDEPDNPQAIPPLTRGGWPGEDHADWPGDDAVSLPWPRLCHVAWLAESRDGVWGKLDRWGFGS